MKAAFPEVSPSNASPACDSASTCPWLRGPRVSRSGGVSVYSGVLFHRLTSTLFPAQMHPCARTRAWCASLAALAPTFCACTPAPRLLPSVQR